MVLVEGRHESTRIICSNEVYARPPFLPSLSIRTSSRMTSWKQRRQILHREDTECSLLSGQFGFENEIDEVKLGCSSVGMELPYVSSDMFTLLPIHPTIHV